MQKTAKKYTSPCFEVARAKVVLLATEGLENTQIAGRLDLPRQVVSKWRGRFFHEHPDGLEDRPRRRRPRSGPELLELAGVRHGQGDQFLGLDRADLPGAAGDFVEGRSVTPAQ